MIDCGKLLGQARRRAQLTRTELAALANVSLSVVSRTEAGLTTPAADTFIEMLNAAGFILKGNCLERWSCPSAGWAARWLLGDLEAKPPQADEWTERWERIDIIRDGKVLDVDSLLFRAGRSAVLGSRPGAVSGRCERLAPHLASSLAGAGIDYVVTGDQALEEYGTEIIPRWPVLYVEDVIAAAGVLGITPLFPGQNGRALVTLIPFDGYSEQGSSLDPGGMKVVNPFQALVDGYAGYGRMMEQAQELVKGWLVPE
ncbi:MAG: helix-turn-helix domain-containing protein [Propionibacteriaceae bacterium]|jgi:transcriptional regulator with XRE-family HTH domain|nr:helix-turn-helix domain-containing protein [Propionibacteriaceae bacterium]